MNVTIFGIDYECTKAVKGPDFVRLYQDDTVILSCLGVTDFSGYTLTDGEWSDPDPDLSVIATGAELVDGSIVIAANGIIGTGTMLKFKAPCDCTAVTGGLVIDEKTYTIVDSVGKNVAGGGYGRGGMWASDALVSVLIDKANLRAFIQNAAKPAGVLDIENGGTGANSAVQALISLGASFVEVIERTGTGTESITLRFTKTPKAILYFSTSGGKCSGWFVAFNGGPGVKVHHGVSATDSTMAESNYTNKPTFGTATKITFSTVNEFSSDRFNSTLVDYFAIGIS